MTTTSLIASAALAVLLACSSAAAPEQAEPTTDVAPSTEAKRVRAEQCAALIEKARADRTVRTLISTIRLVPENADEATRDAADKAAEAACERDYARLPKYARDTANKGCDVNLISLPAGEGLLKMLCADPDVRMVTEEQVMTPAGGGH
jgi:hypothetical protein